MAQSDPTDHALAAIASILDPPESRREPEKAAVAEQRPVAPPPIPVAPAPIEAHGYSKHGPGPMAAIRFKWTVRLDNGDYYVDETIGENSAPIVSGPMSTGSRDPDGRRSRKRRTPALRAIEERDDRTRRRRQSGSQGQQRGIASADSRCVIAAVPENPSWQYRRRHGAGCRRPS